MLKLAQEQILLNQTAASKEEAIALLAERLTQADLVEAGYVAGMLAREAQHATYLGSGIAIPHGTTETRHLVKQTGVMVAQFPAGIEWDQGQVAYVAIGIAAKSDEHLGILRQLTHVLGDEQAALALKDAKDAATIIDILTGASAPAEVQFLTLADFPADDADQLLLGAAARAKSAGWGGAEMVTALMASQPRALGQGIWLASARAQLSGWVLATPSHAISHQDAQVKALLLLCGKDESHLTQLDNLAALAAAGQLDALAGSEGLALLQNGPAKGLADTFTIINPHGLHARPGAMLVKVAKEYGADIRVANLDGSGEAVSAKSLMKVIGLGVKCGHRLEFRAEGADAEAALRGIGEAIKAGLGEGAH
ncbi:fused PTS fructose transporter subunit IIA/HPr protein [Aeromonas sp. BIGb0445]|uniref:fused PTS fructose transporter subunit IIA/HPr protein n=1 Tax=Aeromonas sp. BIGb0445 TaxID=2940593 RepID=UPI0021693AFF|nr:fused PTS fructose transporter subunit IIA/HPr protein [Aeromonas sp. BIGb0445]MCS3459048.1 phosphocarrier protein FPr [Aeromonas sp. BIGb0445]